MHQISITAVRRQRSDKARMTMPGVKALTPAHLGLLSRLLAATLGTYVLVNLLTVAFSFLLQPVMHYYAFLFGIQSSFLWQAIAMLWVFSARTATRAWLGLLGVGVPVLLFDAWFWWQGAAL